MALAPEQKVTKEEYFKMLAESDHKLEFVNGEVVMMTDGSKNHTAIVDNAYFTLRSNQGECRAWSSEAGVSINSLNRYYFPDVSVVCGDKSKFNPETKIAQLLNPCLLVEVVSETSSDRDRTEKFRAYRQLESFKEYILIDSRSYLIDVFYRESSEYWHFRSYTLPDQRVKIHSLGIELPVSVFYENVVFAENENLL
ncbi:Uma2 family endonuclease [Neolewinella agarilytica]|uniref:Endonuclease, Uma2 family (Restriction endonuclease fold) n=1 Tax=Neolewinella agarilytica TaxID=478744 RepID=A0A1H9ICK2_9BACT|nr:Uma2 family endonuclease [Neolewinella agarilytica]SEQ72290.1 Endonuclease, Uma2 family (restriction endonuclease fold) [Neolewinella agarilytica]